ncbi:copper resistance protein CopC [Streptosporangium sp. NPDC001559]|uniref:copper resistance CopC family protein n=1 Tax=Streptosporangium sp. NPDC001559 TaxID=3366187 RepID=UPI0036EEE764
MLVGTASPAFAHDRLKSSSPAANAKVTSPETVTLEFSSRMRFAKVVLTGPGDETTKLDAPDEGSTIRAKVPAQLAPGRYQIAWHVASSDGHPISGQIPFTVIADPDSPSPSPTPESPSPSVSTPASTEAASAAPSEAVTPPAAEPSSAAAPEPSGASGLPGWVWPVGAVVVLAGAGAWLITRRKGTQG